MCALSQLSYNSDGLWGNQTIMLYIAYEGIQLYSFVSVRPQEANVSSLQRQFLTHFIKGQNFISIKCQWLAQLSDLNMASFYARQKHISGRLLWKQPSCSRGNLICWRQKPPERPPVSIFCKHILFKYS